MQDHKQDNTLAIIGLVVGGLGLLISMIPCVGVLGVFPGVIGVVLGLIAYFKAKDNGDRKTLSVVALVISAITIGLSAFWYFSIKNAGSAIQEIDVDKYTNCDSLVIDMAALRSDIIEFRTKAEANGDGLTVLRGMKGLFTKSATLAKMETRANELGCEYELTEEDIEVFGKKGSIDSTSSN